MRCYCHSICTTTVVSVRVSSDKIFRYDRKWVRNWRFIEQTIWLSHFQWENDIKNVGKPVPALLNLKVLHKVNGREYFRYFNVQVYEKIDWPAGNCKLGKLFCWPCLLLFSKRNRGGYTDLNNSPMRHKTLTIFVICVHLFSLPISGVFASKPNLICNWEQMLCVIMIWSGRIGKCWTT